MRILVIIHEFPPVGGGGGRAAEDICTRLARNGHELTVLTAHLKGLPREERREGVRIIRLPSLRRQPYRAGLPAMGAFVLAGIAAGDRLIRYWHPDVIHVHFAVPAGAVAWVLSRRRRVPYVLTAHLGDVPGGVPEKTGRWFRWLFPLTPPIWREARQVIAVSEYTRQLALQRYPVDIQVIPNGVDLKSLRPEKIQVNQPPQLVFAGRFMPQKNPVQVVRSLAALKDLAWHCVMIGDGPLAEAVQREISTQGLDDRFTLTGWISPEDVLNWFSKSDLLFMPSRAEGLPVVGVQALAKGLAIVAGHAGGFIDLVDEGRNGFLIRGQSGDGFSAVLRGLLSDPRQLLAFREASLSKAGNFDLDPVVESYASIFTGIVNDRRD